MLIKNNSSRTVKVAIFNSDDGAQTVPLSGGAFTLGRGKSRNFNAPRKVRVKFFVPGLFDQFITGAIADTTQNVTLGSNNRAAVSGTARPAKPIAGGQNADIQRVVTNPSFLRGMAQASSTGSNPNVINSLRQAVNRDQRFVEPILNRQASNIEGILNSGAFSNLRGTLASGNQTQIGTNALKVTRLPLFESLALELAGSGFETYGITGGFSLSFITGIDFSGGEYTHRDPDSRQVISKKNISSVGPSFGLQLGGAVPIQMCWFKDEPENLGGWCRVAVVGGFSPLILPLAVVFYYQLEDSSSSSLIGMGIMGGPGIEISFATGWCFSWVH